MVAKWLKNVIYTLTILKLWFQIKKKKHVQYGQVSFKN